VAEVRNVAVRTAVTTASSKKVRCCRRCRLYIRKWRAMRWQYYLDLCEMIQTMEELEDFDWEHLDAGGRPRPKPFWVPGRLRWLGRFLLLACWDPLVDMFDRRPSSFAMLRCLAVAIPAAACLVGLTWVSYSSWRNHLYVEGDCSVMQLPSRYELPADHDLRIEPVVRGQYTVKRFFAPTSERPEGLVVQECSVQVVCKQVDYGSSNSREDDRCVNFQSWARDDRIPCYYHEDDLYGFLKEQLFCESPPSDLRQETFTCIIAGVLAVLSMIALGIHTRRSRETRKQQQLEIDRIKARAKELEEARKIIAEKEAEDARLRGEVDGFETDEDGETEQVST